MQAILDVFSHGGGFSNNITVVCTAYCDLILHLHSIVEEQTNLFFQIDAVRKNENLNAQPSDSQIRERHSLEEYYIEDIISRYLTDIVPLIIWNLR